MSEMKTITELLNKVKLITKQIERDTGTGTYIISAQVEKFPVGYSSCDVFKQKAKSTYQSITDLLEYRNKVKAAIVKSNANTTIVVDGITYTVAEAIERKNSINFEKMLLAHMTRQYQSVLALVEKENQRLQIKLDSLIETTVGKDKSDVNAIKTLTENFWKINKVEIIDPLDLKDKIEQLQLSIDNFSSEIDYKLTIINSRTEVEV